MTSPLISAHGWTGDPSAATLRLTTRGRSLLLALAALTVCAILIGATASALTASDTHPAAPAPVAETLGATLAAQGRAIGHTVVAGDTLWDLASALDPDADPRRLVDRIQQINGMTGSDLSIGRVIWLPVSPAAQHAQG